MTLRPAQPRTLLRPAGAALAASVLAVAALVASWSATASADEQSSTTSTSTTSSSSTTTSTSTSTSTTTTTQPSTTTTTQAPAGAGTGGSGDPTTGQGGAPGPSGQGGPGGGSGNAGSAPRGTGRNLSPGSGDGASGNQAGATDGGSAVGAPTLAAGGRSPGGNARGGRASHPATTGAPGNPTDQRAAGASATLNASAKGDPPSSAGPRGDPTSSGTAGSAASSSPTAKGSEPPLVLRMLGSPFASHIHLTPLLAGLLILFLLLAAGLTVVAFTTLWWMLHAWRTPETLASTGFVPPASGARTRSYSLIVPARHEEAVLGTTLTRLAELDHPSFEVLAVVGDDDPATAQVAERVALEHPGRVKVLVDHSKPKNKPRALNTALSECTGEVTGVFDAEDEVHPELLRHVDACFESTGADVVQGGVQLMNYRSSWWALHNVLEYYFWFRSRLHFHADWRFIPLGGNTVFVRTDLLKRSGGWDPNALAEDCDLGVRLSTAGAQVAVAYEAGLVTREETPHTISALVRQRTRWNQGFLQVLRKGVWKQLPTVRQRLLARYTLAMPFLQGLTGVLIPLSILAMIALRLPEPLVLLSFIPALVTILTIAVQAAGLREFCHSYGHKARIRDYLRLALGTPVYLVVLSLAAVRAVGRELRGDRSWEKTAHLGAHRTEVAPATGAT